MNTFLQIVTALAAACVIFPGICIVNRMSLRTNHVVRVAYCMLLVGAFGEINAVLAGHVPGIAEALFVCGFGLFQIYDRRSCPFYISVVKGPNENKL